MGLNQALSSKHEILRLNTFNRNRLLVESIPMVKQLVQTTNGVAVIDDYHRFTMKADKPNHPSYRMSSNECIVKIKAVNICEADIRYLTGMKTMSEVASPTCCHEAVGEVRTTGSKKIDFSPGDLVAIKPHIVSQKVREQYPDLFADGEIHRLDTHHLGMDAPAGLGLAADYVVLPSENLVKISIPDKGALKMVAKEAGVHYTAPLAEIEHVGCIHTAFEEAVKADPLLFENLREEGGKILLQAAGWMSYLWLIFLKREIPNATVHVVEPDLHRFYVYAASAASWGCEPEVTSMKSYLDKEAGSFDLVICCTSNHKAPDEAGRWVRVGGHVIFFSGINGGGRVMDPSKTVDVEGIHRRGGNATAYKDELRMRPFTISGSSGYKDSCFEEAIPWVIENFSAVAAGITGVILGLDSDKLLARPSRTDYESEANRQAIASRHVVEPIMMNGISRNAHLKIAIHPCAGRDFEDAYSDWLDGGE